MAVALERTVLAFFTARESFDVGLEIGSTVSPDLSSPRPFKSEGKVRSLAVEADRR
jgi:arylsulfatase